MRTRKNRILPPLFLVLSLASGLGGPPAVGSEPADNLIGQSIENFALQDFRGANHSLAEVSTENLVVVVFLGTECPLAQLYGPELERLARQFAPRGVTFFGINANSQDSISDLADYARRSKIGFPLLKDTANRVADMFSATRTPQAFVLDRDRKVRYVGRIDDRCGVGYVRDKATREDLRTALDELLAGREVTQPRTPAEGCLIGRILEPQASSPVTYSQQIARIFQRHCVECHRPGEIAPFPLVNYAESVGWAETIAEVIRDQRMPPWHADPSHGEFVNARRMSDEEKELVYQWVRNGAPEGDPAQLPAPVSYVTGWRLSRPPDQIIAMRDRPFVVPAEGTVEYQYFVVDPQLKEDKWICGAEVIPGNRSVVHHAIVFFRAPEGVEQRGLGWLTAYVPGQSAFELASHQARFVPAGSKFVFQMHYTPTGTPQEDRTRVGLLFADERDIQEELLTVAVLNHDFEIPPQARDFTIRASRAQPLANAKILAVAPHMHVRGRTFRIEAVTEGSPEQREVLLDVPHYDFNWQHAYQLARPLPWTKAMRIECTASYDNSEFNRVNPDPNAVVRWGDQTWEEMMIAFIEVAVPADPHRYRGSSREASLTAEQQRQAEQTAADLIRRFDRNADGIVASGETPQAFAAFAFQQIDANGDKQITYDEARAAAVHSLRRRAARRGL